VMGWLRQHHQAFRVGLRRIGVLNALVIGVAVSLPTGGYALLESLRSLAGRATLEPQISLFMRPEAKRAEADALGRALRADRRVASVRFVPREEALKQLGAVEGMGEVIASLGRNPLPDAFVVTASQGTLEPLAAELGKLPGVAHVQADSVWAQRLGALERLGRLGLALLAALLGAGLVAVTFNTIRLQILIRRPFYYLGLLQGAAGGAFALVIVAALLAVLNSEVRPLADSYGSGFRFAFLSLSGAAAVLALAGGLGWLGAHLSVSRHLRQIEPR
jgi:cell division transport system permease protein